MLIDKTELMMQEADQFLDFGNFSSALSTYSKILEINPDHDEAYSMMGSVHGELGNINLAMESLNKAVDLNPKNADAWLVKGLLQKNVGNKSSALESLKNAVKYASDYDVAHFNLAKLLLDTGEMQSAIHSLNQTIDCNPQHIDALHTLATVHQANANHIEALECFRSVLKIDPKHRDSLRRIPVELIAIENFVDAETFTLEAIEIIPDEPWLYKNLSDIRFEQSRLYEAVEYAEKAMKCSNGNTDFVMVYANLLEKKGEYEQVLDLLKPMLEINPPIYNAVVLFAKFAPFLDMQIQAEKLILRQKNVPGMVQKQTDVLNTALLWLRQQA